MPDDTPKVAAAPNAAAPPAAAPPATPVPDPQAPTTPPLGTSQADIDSRNAGARRVAEREVKDEMDAKDAELTTFREADKARKLEEMTELEKANALTVTANEATAAVTGERDALAAQVAQAERTSAVDRSIAASETRVPAVYLGAVRVALSTSDGEVTQEAVDAALTQASEQWKTDAGALGVPAATAPKDVGSPGAPAATPPEQGADPAEVEAAAADLAQRMLRGEPGAYEEALEKYPHLFT